MSHIDSINLTFGKYRGRSPNEVSDLDPEYVTWMYDNVRPRPCSKALRDACEEDIRRGSDAMFDPNYDCG